MGSENARNTVHLSCGYSYRFLNKQVQLDLEKTRPFIGTNENAKKAWDYLLAKNAFYRSILLTNDPTMAYKNQAARAENRQLNHERFCRFFDHIMNEYLEVIKWDK